MAESPHTPPPAAPPAGWHPDPQGLPQQRYWDGSRWTEHTAPLQPQATGGGDARQWALIAHLSALAGLVVGFNFLGPLIVYLVKRDEGGFVRHHAAEALNFNLSVFIYAVVGGLLTVVLVFFIVGILLIPLIVVAAIAWVVLVVVAAVKANQGELYRYPLTIRLVD